MNNKNISISIKKACLIGIIFGLVISIIISFLSANVLINIDNEIIEQLKDFNTFSLARYFIPTYFVISSVNIVLFIFICKWQSNKNK